MSKHKDGKRTKGKLYAFIWTPPGEESENCVVYAIAASKEEKDRFIKERGCRNMVVHKCDTAEELLALGEHLRYSQETPYLYEYKVGLSKNGEDLSMLMPEQEHDEVMRNIRKFHDDIVKSSMFSGAFFKKKYRDALNIITQWPISKLKMCMHLFSDTFSFDNEEEDS